jgi:hypothetical protein
MTRNKLKKVTPVKREKTPEPVLPLQVRASSPTPRVDELMRRSNLSLSNVSSLSALDQTLQ